MLSLYSWCRNVGDPHFIDIAHVGTPWRVGSRAMNLINLMSLSFDMNPSSRKRIRSELSNSETEHVDDSTDDEGESKLPYKQDVNYPRFIVFKPTYGHQSLTKLSPFAVQKSIQGRFGTVKQVTRMKDGSLLIEASRNIQAKHLLETQSFLDIEIDAEAHHSLNTSKGVIRDYHKDLLEMSDQEIKTELSSQGVIGVSRFVLKKEGKEIKTNTLFVTFDSHKPPEKIKLGYYIVNVQPYVPNPLRCFNCQKFGHSKKWCKNKIACWKCGEEGHDGSDCASETVSCLNCKGDHFASSKSCPVWIREKEIQRIRTEKSLPYHEARKLVTSSSSSSSSATTSYASIARSTTKTVSVDCQTPAFWIGPQPSLREASRLPSVQTASTGSGTSDKTSTHESSGNKNINTRKSSPAKSSSISRNNKNISNKHVVKENSKSVETGNRFQNLSSDVSEDMDTTQSSRPSRSSSRSRNRSRKISPIQHQ